VIRPATVDRLGRDRYIVQCICGTEAIVLAHALENGNTTGCRSIKCRQAW